MNFELLASQTERLAHAHIVESTDVTLAINAVQGFSALILCLKRDNNATSPCGQCQSCMLYQASNHPDLLEIGREGASVGVDEVRSISTFLSKTPHIAGRQLVIVYNADKMTESAANAVLKTLEEPSPNSYILLISGNKHNQVATIRSRCQVWSIDAAEGSLNQEVPNYVLGYAAGAMNKINLWLEQEVIEHFESTYKVFIQWLKGQQSAASLVEQVQTHNEMVPFLLYLLERRIRQLLLKNIGGKVQAADQQVTKFLSRLAEFRNQGQQVALMSLLLELEDNLR